MTPEEYDAAQDAFYRHHAEKQARLREAYGESPSEVWQELQDEIVLRYEPKPGMFDSTLRAYGTILGAVGITGLVMLPIVYALFQVFGR